MHSKPKVLVSLTSIPRRFPSALPAVLESLSRQDLECDIVLNIPTSYKKWGLCPDSSIPNLPAGIILNRTSQDFGPATKLLGALEYARNKDYSHIITVDDDILLKRPDYLRYLMACNALTPGCITTVGGIRLQRPPYRVNRGLNHHNILGFADVPRGYSGVVYPAAPLTTSGLPFTLKDKLPDGVFHDDDAYFGAVAHSLGIPIVGIPACPRGSGGTAQGSGDSGVAEKTNTHRIENESQIFQSAAQQGLISTKATRSKMPSARKRAIFRVYLRALFGQQL